MTSPSLWPMLPVFKLVSRTARRWKSSSVVCRAVTVTVPVWLTMELRRMIRHATRLVGYLAWPSVVDLGEGFPSLLRLVRMSLDISKVEHESVMVASGGWFLEEVNLSQWKDVGQWLHNKFVWQ